MKKQFIIVFICLCVLKNYSQSDSIKRINKKEIDVNYNWSDIGRSLNINYNHYFGRHALTVGVKQHYNSVITDNQSYLYKKRGYSTNFQESIGLNIGYKYDLLKKSSFFMPYLFFQSQISNIRFKNTYENIETSSSGLYIRTISEITEPIFVTENYIGLGLKIKLFKHLFLNETIGGGLATFKGEHTNGRFLKNPINYNIEFSHSIKIGLIYQLN